MFVYSCVCIGVFHSCVWIVEVCFIHACVYLFSFMRVYRGVSFIHACVYLCSFMRMFICVLVVHNLMLMLWRFHKTEITV